MSHARTSRFFDERRVQRALEGARTQCEAIAELGYPAHADNFRRLLGACIRFGLDLPGVPSTSTRRLVRLGEDRAAFAAVLGECLTVAEVCRAYEVPVTAAAAEAVRAWAERHGLEVPGRRIPGRALQRLGADHAALRTAVVSSRSAGEACRKLGEHPHPAARRRLLDDAAALGVTLGQETSERPAERGHARRAADALTKEELLSALVDCRGETAALVALNVTESPAARAWLRELLARHEHTLPVAGRTWAVPRDEFFAAGTVRSTASLRHRIEQERLLPFDRCSMCSLGSTWQGAPLVLELDHISGDRGDNRLSNLRYLCPNCHSQTPTFRGRNRKTRS